MLKTKLTHPEILQALARAGHGSRVLIADGDYPVGTMIGKNAEIVSLNLTAGCVSALEVLNVLVDSIPFEAALVMDTPEHSPSPAIWANYQDLLTANQYEFQIRKTPRSDFYENAAQDSTALVIQTGETQEYANLLLTVGSLW